MRGYLPCVVAGGVWGAVIEGAVFEGATCGALWVVGATGTSSRVWGMKL